MKNKLTLCIDVGGTHIAAAVLDNKTIALYNDAKEYGYVDSNADKDSILSQWNIVISAVLKKVDASIHCICVSIPGPFDYVNGICQMDGMHKYQSLLGMHVKSWLADVCQVSPSDIHFYNDAEAFLLGELYHKSLFNKKVVGLTLGTGLGSSFYDSTEVIDLNYGSAAFRQGIAEDYISTRGLLTFLKNEHGLSFTDIKSVALDESLGEKRTAVFSYLADSLADFIREHIYKLSTDVIVLGGSIAKAHALFLDQLQSQVDIPIHIASMDEFNVFAGMASVKQSN